TLADTRAVGVNLHFGTSADAQPLLQHCAGRRRALVVTWAGNDQKINGGGRKSGHVERPAGRDFGKTRKAMRQVARFRIDGKMSRFNAAAFEHARTHDLHKTADLVWRVGKCPQDSFDAVVWHRVAGKKTTRTDHM